MTDECIQPTELFRGGLSQPGCASRAIGTRCQAVYLRRSSPSSVTEFAGAYICLCYSARWLARAISTLTSREDRSKQGALSATAPTRARFRRRAPQGESARDPERPFGPARSPATPQVLPRTRMRLKRPSVHVARAIDRALSGEMVKTLTPAARGDGDGSVLCGNQTSGACRNLTHWLISMQVRRATSSTLTRPRSPTPWSSPSSRLY